MTPELVSDTEQARRYRLTPKQARMIRDLVERGMSGEFDRITIDFRARSFYVDTMRRVGGTMEQQKHGVKNLALDGSMRYD